MEARPIPCALATIVFAAFLSIFSVSPHMHQLGTQRYYSIDPVPLAKGDQVRVECTHTNTTDKTVTFGDSSLAEMCFAGIYRYPANGDPFACVQGARL